ncbi:hypothetical protein [Streptomyces sp. NPDC090022]|uniref:hypothetical protein n=1 Tax=Streptomyces sp. NPDC090022 TaxID=3365920 RepID=UPI0037F451F5
MTAWTRSALAPAGLVAMLVLSGCGIRATTVPVDVGAAPSRVSCDTPAQASPAGVQGFRATVELICGSQLVGVDRVVPVPEKRASKEPVVLVAQALLEALEKAPSGDERDAGFSTGVPALTVAPPRAGDPVGTLRLSRRPEDLPPVALAQIVCTLAESEAVSAGAGPVVLGGPDPDPPRAFECTDAVRSRPESASTLGEIVRPDASAGASTGTGRTSAGPGPSPSPGGTKSP